jgi:hypothetical protein
MEQQRRVVLLVGTDCGVPEREAEFIEWYSQVHDPFMVERGAARATCYRQLRQMPGQSGRDAPSISPRFLGLYEFESREAFDKWRENGLPLGNDERGRSWPPGESFLRWAAAFELVGEVTPESLQQAISEGRYAPRLTV